MQEKNLGLFKLAQEVLSNSEIDKKCDIRLDCANIANAEFDVPKKTVVNTYPLLEDKTLKAFRVKLASFGVNLKNVDVGVTHSIFDFLKEALLKISFNELKKHKRGTKILLSKEQFGYFHNIIEESGAEPVLIETNKDGKINLEDLQGKLAIAKEDSCVGFIFLNPINPTQVIYSQDDVDDIANVLQNGKLDFAFEDMTFMDVYNKRYDEALFDEELNAQRLSKRTFINEDGKARGRSNSVDDKQRFEGINPAGTFAKTDMANKTMSLYSISKSYTASARISSFTVPHGLLPEIKLGNTNIGSYEFPYQNQWRVQSTVLGVEPDRKHIFNYDRIPLEVMKHYKAMHNTYASKCDVINKMFSEKLELPYHEFISVKPKEWQSTNVANLDFSGLKNFLIDGKKLTNGIDVFMFLAEKTGTKTIPCEANFIEGTQVRVSLGEQKEKVNEFFSRLTDYLLSAEVKKDNQITNFTGGFIKEKLDITNMSMLNTGSNTSMIEDIKKEVQREQLSERRSKSQPKEKTIDF